MLVLALLISDELYCYILYYDNMCPCVQIPFNLLIVHFDMLGLMISPVVTQFKFHPIFSRVSHEYIHLISI